jgi:hypothetical protein
MTTQGDKSPVRVTNLANYGSDEDETNPVSSLAFLVLFLSCGELQRNRFHPDPRIRDFFTPVCSYTTSAAGRPCNAQLQGLHSVVGHEDLRDRCGRAPW